MWFWLVINLTYVKKRTVKYEEGEILAKKYGCRFFEVSAKSKFQVDEAIESLLDSDYCHDELELKRPGENVKKPVILFYNYNEGETIDVQVRLHKNAKFEHLYPKPTSLSESCSKWKIKFLRNNLILLPETGREYPYLFWEADCRDLIASDLKEFYSFESDSVEDKIDLILEKIGLNSHERCDLITFWIGQLKSKKYVQIKFLVNDEIKVNCLIVKPRPSYMLRVLMVFKTVNNLDQNTVSQVTYNADNNSVERDGTVVVEWGGVNISS